jgi:hypothetical protein
MAEKTTRDSDDENKIYTFGKPPCKILVGLESLSSFGVFDSTLKLWRRELPLPSGQFIRLLENPNDSTEGGELFIWPASLLLSKFLMENPAYVKGQNVIELGASHGMVAMTASTIGANLVAATDRHHVMPYLKSNLALNPSCRCAIVVTARLSSVPRCWLHSTSYARNASQNCCTKRIPELSRSSLSPDQKSRPFSSRKTPAYARCSPARVAPQSAVASLRGARSPRASAHRSITLLPPLPPPLLLLLPPPPPLLLQTQLCSSVHSATLEWSSA